MFAISKIRVSANRHHRDTVKIGVWFSGELFADTEQANRMITATTTTMMMDGRAMVWASSIKVILMGRRQTDLGGGKNAGWVGR